MKFCGECAALLASKCPSCGASNPPEHKFCGQCAAPLRATAAVKSATPESYTPKHLAEKILTSKAALEGERKQVTVLFADLKGSMELLADRDPEEARKLLDPVLEHMMEAVHRYEGTVNQVMGDGIMALFGAPLAHEDHAVRACYAALRMQESVKRYADGVFRTYGVPVRIRVGLNSGEVVVRSIGSDLHMDYTAVGQTTHLAARMEQMADPGVILLTSATLHLAEGFVHVQSLGHVAVKGLATPAEIFALTGVSPMRSRLQAAAARGLTTFVGRDAEMDTLFTALEQAKAGKGQLVAVVGEPGVGKSRLFWEFAHSHRTHGCLVLEAASVSYGKATVYFPVIDLLKGYFQIEPRDEPRKVREKITGKLFSLDRTLESCLAPLLWLLDVPVEDPEWDRLDPPQRRQRLLDSLRRLVLRESQEQPLVLVFEDLHWIDGETQALLDHLVESLPTARLLLLVNYRPEYAHGWGRKTYYRQLRIDPLSPASAEQLLGALLGHDPSMVALGPMLIARTEGNPFFIEETVQSLIETGALSGDRGAYRLVKPSQALNIPATAQSVLAARIDRLAPEDKRLLQTASVIGKEVPYPLLQAIAEMDETALRAGLARLQASEFLYEARLFPDLEYTFKHALTLEVAYGSLLTERRRALHGRIVIAMEEAYAERIGEQAQRVGEHAFRSEDWQRAARYLRQAGAKALSKAALADAAAQFERALTALEHLPATPQTLEQRVDVRFSLHDALLPMGAYKRIVDVVREAEAVASELDDRRRLGRAYSYLSHHAWIALADHDSAIAYAERALDLARAESNAALEIVANFYIGQTRHSQGNLPASLAAFARNISLLSGETSRRAFDTFYMINSCEWAAYPYSDLGRCEEGLAAANRGLQLAEASGNPILVIAACTGMGLLYSARGEFSRAIAQLDRAMSFPMIRDVPQRFGPAASALGGALVSVGRTEEAICLMEEALGVAQMIAAHRSLYLIGLGEAFLAAGRGRDALTAAEEGLAVARRRGERGFEARALRLLGAIHSGDGGADAAQSEAW
jgi:predicted ATPase/class 3 adenylate cyclase